jgi:hypothetical protein
MRGGAEFDEVILRGAKIGDQISMIGSKFTGKLNMGSTKVGGAVFARNSVFDENAKWSLIFAEIGSNLDLRQATLTVLDLTGTRIGGELRLGTAIRDDAPNWRNGSRMTLRNTNVGAVQDREDSWPKMLELEGFTYRRLGGFGGEGTADIGKRNSVWSIEWLARDPTYSPQPYEHLADVLRQSGQPEKADDVLYAGRERERAGVATGLDFVWKTVLHAFIGHGYRVHRALYWILGFVVLGAVVLRISGEGQRNRMPIGLSYSLDTLIPIVRLREYHYSHVDLAGWARYYFYVHQLMGYVLASFLIAGLSGLTK